MWELLGLLGLLGLHGPFVAWVRDEGISECVYTCILDDPFVGVDAAPTPPCTGLLRPAIQSSHGPLGFRV